MTALPAEKPVGDAFVTRLLAALGANRAGYGQRPSDGGPQDDGSFHGYAVVYPGSTVPLEGTAAAPNADGSHTVQVTYVGADAGHADTVRDTGRAAVLAAGAITVSGRALISPVELVDSQLARKDDAAQKPTWLAVDRYQVLTTPA